MKRRGKVDIWTWYWLCLGNNEKFLSIKEERKEDEDGMWAGVASKAHTVNLNQLRLNFVSYRAPLKFSKH